MGVRLSCRQVKISLKEANSKEEWQPKKFSALSSSLPLRLLQHPNAMTRKRQPTRRPTQQQRSTHCIQRLQRIQEDIISHFANASTPSLDIPMHTGETQTPCVGPRGQEFATLTAMLTVATSNQLPVHQGASLP